MIVSIQETPSELDRLAAIELIKEILKNPESNIGLATGNTTAGMYQESVGLIAELGLDLTQLSFFGLDDYVGLSPAIPASCGARLCASLFRPLAVQAGQIHLPNTERESLPESCARYDAEIEAAGGVDLQILGIGENGHLGFNEPGTSFETRTHIVKLSLATLAAARLKFEGLGYSGELPDRGITMGIRTIMNSRRILLLAKGSRKARIIKQALTGAVIPDVPASVLQLHPDVTVLLDQSAGAELD
jgi:glucosamine-6-phosphate deaminase